MQDKVCIVVLNWNGWSDTATCLPSLRNLDYENFHVIVVDNGSSDGSSSRIRNEFRWVRVIESSKNLGFAGGCNIGIRRALSEGADFVWLLNNDTTVDSNALRALVDVGKSSHNTGAVGSAIYFVDEPRRIQAWGGGFVNFWLGRSRHFTKPVPDDQIEFITGASILISRQAINRVGLLDEEFFMYWEDADYCFRLRAAGFSLRVAADSKIWHKGSASLGKESASLDRYFNASAARFFDKHGRIPKVALWVGVGLRLAKRIIAGDWERARAVWAGVSRF